MKLRIAAVVACCLLLTGCFTNRVLYIGVVSSDEHTVRKALSEGANPNELYYGSPLIVLAAEQGDSTVLRMLIDHQADLHATRTLRTSQFPAFLQYREAPNGVRTSTDHPAQIVTYDALCAAAGSNSPQIIDQLLQAGFDLTRATPNPIICAVQGKQPKIAVNKLIAAGAALGNRADDALMHRAVANAQKPEGLLSLLADHGVDINQALPQPIHNVTEDWLVNEGLPPLGTALARSQYTNAATADIRELLDAGANPNTYTAAGESMLALSGAFNCSICTTQLLAVGAKLENVVWDQMTEETKLNYLQRNSTEIIALMIDAGALPPATHSFTSHLIERLNQRARDWGQPQYTSDSANRYQLALRENYPVIPGKIGQQLRHEAEAEERARQKRLEVARREAEAKRQAQLAAQRKADEARRRAEEQERLARERQRAIQAEKQRLVDKAIKNMWQQSTEFDQLLTTLGAASADCSNHRELYDDVRSHKCYFKDKYYSSFESESCMALKDQAKESIRDNKAESCRNFKDAQRKVISMFDNKLEVNSVTKEISRRAKNASNTYRRLKQDYNDPVAALERAVEADRRAENAQQAAREREAWASVVRAASNPNVQSHVSDQFKRNYESINRLALNQAALNASNSQINQQLTKAKSYLKQNPIKVPSIGSTSTTTTQAQALNRNKAACDAKGGRFDASRNNCAIVTQYQTAVVQQLGMNTTGSSATTSLTTSGASTTSASRSTTSTDNEQRNATSSSDGFSSSSSSYGSGHGNRTQAKENQWKIRTECGNTNFDKTMPAPAEVCRNPAPPNWEIHWHYKPYFDGIHLVRLSLKNTSNTPLEFVMRGRVSADMSHRDFEWRVIVPAHSTRTKADGLDLDDVPHVIDIKHLKYRRAH